MKDTIYDLIAGKWCIRIQPLESFAKEALIDAVVVYTTEPSPETGHVGWCWWAAGRMGEADSLEDAKRAAEAAVARRKGR